MGATASLSVSITPAKTTASSTAPKKSFLQILGFKKTTTAPVAKSTASSTLLTTLKTAVNAVTTAASSALTTAQMQAASKQAAAAARATATKPGQVYNGPTTAQMQEASKQAAAAAQAKIAAAGRQVYNGPSVAEMQAASKQAAEAARATAITPGAVYNGPAAVSPSTPDQVPAAVVEEAIAEESPVAIEAPTSVTTTTHSNLLLWGGLGTAAALTAFFLMRKRKLAANGRRYRSNYSAQQRQDAINAIHRERRRNYPDETPRERRARIASLDDALQSITRNMVEAGTAPLIHLPNRRRRSRNRR